MPIYEYECNECHEIHEVSQGLSDSPKTTCPTCTGPLKKLISMSSFQLKGGGWYSDGYSNCNDKSKSEKNNSPSSSATSSAATQKPECPKKDGATCPCQ